MKKEIEVALSSGHTIQLFEHEGKMVLGLVNSNGYYVSDTKLTITEIRTMSRILNDHLADEWLKDEKMPVLNGNVVKQGELNPNFAKESKEASLKYINNK